MPLIKNIIRKEQFQKAKDLVMKKPWLFASISILLLLLISTQLRAAAIVLLLVALAALSKLTEIFFPPPFVVIIDLVSFTLVILSFAYGSFVGIVLTLIAQYAGLMLRSYIKGNVAAETYFAPAAGYITAGILLPFVKPMGLVNGGMIAIGVYALLMMVFYWYIYHNMISEITYAATILPFNYWLLTKFGSSTLALLGA